MPAQLCRREEIRCADLQMVSQFWLSAMECGGIVWINSYNYRTPLATGLTF